MHSGILPASETASFANFAKASRKPSKQMTHACDIVDLAVRLGASLEKYDRIDAQPVADGAHQWAREATSHAYDESEALRDVIASLQANSAAGANVQIAAAIDRFDMLWDLFPTEAKDYRVEMHARALRRLLHSALDFYDTISSHKLDDIAPTLGSRWCNPWGVGPGEV